MAMYRMKTVSNALPLQRAVGECMIVAVQHLGDLGTR